MQSKHSALSAQVLPFPSESIVTPASAESMTFTSHPDRNKYIREQRAYGWEVFLSFQGKDESGSELYSISRRALS